MVPASSMIFEGLNGGLAGSRTSTVLWWLECVHWGSGAVIAYGTCNCEGHLSSVQCAILGMYDTSTSTVSYCTYSGPIHSILKTRFINLNSG